MKQSTCFIDNGEMQYYCSGKDYLYRLSDKKIDIYRCVTCGLERILPLLSPKEMERYYPKHYYSYNETKKTFFLKIRERVIEQAFSEKKQLDIYSFLAILGKLFFSGMPLSPLGKKRFLDVGCGNDYNIRVLEQYGWNCYGFEIGKKAKKGKIYFDSDLSLVDFGAMQFDYIRVWHVLEHVSQPDAFLKKIHALLSPRGKVVVGLPNTRSLYAWLFGKYWYGRDIPRHVVNYNPYNLDLLLSQYGFEITRVKYLSVGGLLGSLQHLLYDKYKLQFDLINNRILVLLLLPLDTVLNLMHYGDSIALEIVKKS